MSEKHFNSPEEIAEAFVVIAEKKVGRDHIKTMILAGLAGAFIAFAAEGSNMAAFNLLASASTYGLGKALAGLMFSTGLMMVVIAGADLFTGNNLIVVGVMEKRVSILDFLLNLLIVYVGNFIGSMCIVYMVNVSGLLNSGGYELGAITLKIASGKVSLSFIQAFVLGIMCNWLVCLAVWMGYAAKDISGKVLAILFPIWLFVTSGFEHSIANMYYIPAGILLKSSPKVVEKAVSLGLSTDVLAHLNWSTFVVDNLVPVTLGNLIGGSFCVGVIYWYVYIRRKLC